MTEDIRRANRITERACWIALITAFFNPPFHIGIPILFICGAVAMIFFTKAERLKQKEFTRLKKIEEEMLNLNEKQLD